VYLFGLFGEILVDGLFDENLNGKADNKKGDCPFIDHYDQDSYNIEHIPIEFFLIIQTPKNGFLSDGPDLEVCEGSNYYVGYER
jgi:hypothetical protein